MGVWYRTELRSGPGRESNRPQDEAPQQSTQVANGSLVCRYGDGRLENVSGNFRGRMERGSCFLRVGLFRAKVARQGWPLIEVRMRLRMEGS